MAWEKVNWKRSEANQLKATNKNTELTCSTVDTGGEGGREERQAPTYHHLRNQAYHLIKEKCYDSALPICSESEQS